MFLPSLETTFVVVGAKTPMKYEIQQDPLKSTCTAHVSQHALFESAGDKNDAKTCGFLQYRNQFFHQNFDMTNEGRSYST